MASVTERIGMADGTLYTRVAAALRDEIARGVHPVGAQLPSEDRLAARFAVSRHTLREALRRLREEGLIASRRGAGTMVVAPRDGDAHVLHAMSIGDLVAFAADAKLSLETVGVTRIDAATAARAGIAAGEEWLAAHGTRHQAADGGALCVAGYYIHRRFASIGRLLPRHEGPVFALIEDMFAVRVAEVEQRIGAVTMRDEDAAALGVEAGAIGLEVRRVYRLADATVAQVTINTHPAARFRHSMTMRRVATDLSGQISPATP